MSPGAGRTAVALTLVALGCGEAAAGSSGGGAAGRSGGLERDSGADTAGGPGGAGDTGEGDGGPEVGGGQDPGSMGSGGPPGFQPDLLLDVGGTPRHYGLHVPSSYDASRPIPLVFHLHGSGLTTKDAPYILTDFTKLGASADKNTFIAVAPWGCEYASMEHAWCESGKDDDVKFLDALIAELLGRYNVDTQRIYVGGFSAGGFFAGVYGFLRSDRVTAISIFAAGLHSAQKPTLAVRKIPVFIRVLSGDSTTAATALVAKLKSLGWPEADIDAEIGKTPGGHRYLVAYNQPQWDFFTRYALP